jgi:hypothetical protein
MNEPTKAPELPSDEFMGALRHGSSIRATCDLCGRVCFEDDETAGDWNDGELEGLRRLAVAEPEKYVALDRVWTGFICGKEAVVNCPCGKLKPYEDFIWSHRHIIARYISARAKAIAEKAVADEQEAEELQDDVNREGNTGEQAQQCDRCGGCGNFFDKADLDDWDQCSDCRRSRVNDNLPF